MDKESASRLLDETFNKDFEINRFIRFVKELFNDFTVSQKECTKYIATQYKDYISSFEKIGDYENGRKAIEVLVVQLNKTSSRDRARTMQRNFIANWLGKTEKDAALVAFYGDDPQDWRFSFVKMEYRLAEVEPGKVKAVKELTPAKRYSFLVGVNEPNHTCRRQFLELVQQEDVNPTLEEIEKAFSIENVTKEFFLNYKELYLGLKESLEEVIEQDPYVKREFEEKNISTIDFAKKLLGQIVFIYFLQKKGWLGVEKEETGRFKSWGTGPKKFLRRLFEKEIVPYDNFFNDILEPLFYEALATERDGDYYSRFNCKIPFLNGGLFEPINDYDWAGTEIVLDNSVFEKILKTFDQYNFTVKEDEPLEKEVAIDPEMLGKVFENLLDIKDRKSTGRYYTPREIVHYMCQQSLINYLETNTPISIPRDDIEKFIQLGDFALDLTIRAQEQKRQYHGKTFKIDESLAIPKPIEDNYKEIDRLLKEIKIVDPAVGSGAFPIGMMNEIVKARSILTLFFDEDEQKKRTVYKFKRETIENSLYGVDIDSSAVDIAKLRFWLSLIVDEEDIENIKPLPNLDHKIMCGNSLLEEFEGVKLFDEKLLIEIPKDYSYQLEQIDREVNKLNQELHDIHTGKKPDNGTRTKQIQRELNNLKREKEQILSGPDGDVPQVTLDEAVQKRIRESQKKLAELKRLQKKFFDEQNRTLKKHYRGEIERIEWKLIEETLREEGNEEAMQKLQQYKKNKSKPFFLWKLYFAEVFQRGNPGFDVVIANPPYVRADSPNSAHADFRKELEESNKYKTLYEKWDLFIPFIERGLKLLSRKGNLRFITSNSLCTSKYAYKLLDLIQEEYAMDRVDYFENMGVFEGVGVIPVVIGISKDKSTVKNVTKTIRQETFENVRQEKSIPLTDFNKMGRDAFRKDYQKVSLDIETEKLGDICYISKGMVINADEKKWKKEFNKDDLISDTASDIHTKKYIEGKYISSYVIHKQKYLEWNTSRVPAKLSRKTFSELYDRPKILRGRVTGAIYDNSRLVCNDSIMVFVRFIDLAGVYNKSIKNSITKFNCLLRKELEEKSKGYDLKYLLAIINSRFAYHFLNNHRRHRLENYFYPDDLRKLPVPKITSQDQQHLITLVDQILSITKSDDYLDNPDKQAKVKRLEKEIDKLVYELYELTPEEIETVEAFNKGK